jgi:hypothetical protein
MVEYPLPYIAAAAVALVSVSAAIHYEALQLCNEGLARLKLRNSRAKVLLAVGAAILSHLTHVTLFALAYRYLQNCAGLGHLGGNFRDVPTGFLYFSLETYTSLGFGDVFPLGEIRMLAGIEALTGLLMVSWTASFTYLEMSRYWQPDCDRLPVAPRVRRPRRGARHGGPARRARSITSAE